MKYNILFGIILLAISSCSLSQKCFNFKQFTLLSYSFSAAKDIAYKDSFMIKRYMLANSKSDTLCFIQKVPFEIINGKVKIYEMGLTERFVNLEQGECYNIALQKDVNHFLDNPEYVKHRKIDFWYKSKKDGIKRKDCFANLILESIIPCHTTL